MPLPCSLDPTSTPPNVPTFKLPSVVGSGDVIILPRDAAGRVNDRGDIPSYPDSVSDVLRFVRDANGGPTDQMQFFSDLPYIEPPEASDVGIPRPFDAAQVILSQEPVLFDSAPPHLNNTYFIYSDPPEGGGPTAVEQGTWGMIKGIFQ